MSFLIQRMKLKAQSLPEPHHPPKIFTLLSQIVVNLLLVSESQYVRLQNKARSKNRKIVVKFDYYYQEFG